MSYLIDLLKTSTMGYKGNKPLYKGADSKSTLHYTYSINGNPKQPLSEPNPSRLSRGGKDFVKYLDVTIKK